MCPAFLCLWYLETARTRAFPPSFFLHSTCTFLHFPSEHRVFLALETLSEFREYKYTYAAHQISGPNVNLSGTITLVFVRLRSRRRRLGPGPPIVMVFSSVFTVYHGETELTVVTLLPFEILLTQKLKCFL